MSIAAVIPNRNGGKILERCLNAAIEARGLDDILVVDDGSTDGSGEEAAAREGIRVLPAAGRGFAAAVNQGVSSTTSELILLLNSDVFLEKDSVTRLQETLDADPRLALCAAGLWRGEGTPAKSRDRCLTLRTAIRHAVLFPPEPLRGRSGIEKVSFVPLACVLVRRVAWADVGGLDERYAFYFEDHDLSWRLSSADWELAVRWDARATHLEGGSSRRIDPQGWFRQYHESRLRYLKKRYPTAWPLYSAVWTPHATGRALLWLVRAAAAEARGDSPGAAGATSWAAAYLRAAVGR